MSICARLAPSLSRLALALASLLVGDASLTYGAQFSYPNDRWDARLAFHEVPAGHAPAVGFTPRPRRHPWIRQVAVGGEVELLTDMNEQPSWRPSAFTGTRTGPRHARCFTCETSCADVRRGAGSRFKLGSLCIEYGDEWPVSDRVVSFQPVLLDRSQGLRVIRNAR